MVTKWAKLIQLSSLSLRIMTCLLFKYMLMICIIFGVSNVSLCEEFAKSMHSEFEMSIYYWKILKYLLKIATIVTS